MTENLSGGRYASNGMSIDDALQQLKREIEAARAAKRDPFIDDRDKGHFNGMIEAYQFSESLLKRLET